MEMNVLGRRLSPAPLRRAVFAVYPWLCLSTLCISIPFLPASPRQQGKTEETSPCGKDHDTEQGEFSSEGQRFIVDIGRFPAAGSMVHDLMGGPLPGKGIRPGENQQRDAGKYQQYSEWLHRSSLLIAS
jgi:hypothetical protein